MTCNWQGAAESGCETPRLDGKRLIECIKCRNFCVQRQDVLVKLRLLNKNHNFPDCVRCFIACVHNFTSCSRNFTGCARHFIGFVSNFIGLDCHFSGCASSLFESRGIVLLLLFAKLGEETFSRAFRRGQEARAERTKTLADASGWCQRPFSSFPNSGLGTRGLKCGRASSLFVGLRQ